MIMASAPTISVKNLRKTFRSYEKAPGLVGAIRSVLKRSWRDVPAVDDLSFEIREGEFVGFLGPNGAGKTTTIKMLSGILTPTSGLISVLGHSPQKRERSLKKKISLVMGQKTQLIWDLPALDTFQFHKDLYQVEEKTWQRSLDELSELLQVTHVLHTPVRQLSLGERMKCEIILALLHQPKVLFLDEPTIGLDIISQMHLWEFLGTYQKTHNLSVLLTSHYVQDIANLCERVIIINKGKKVFDGLFNDLVERMQPERHGILRFKSQLETEHLEKLSQLVKERHLERIDALTYRIRANRPEFSRVTSSILKNFPVEELKMEETDLATVLERSFSMESHS